MKPGRVIILNGTSSSGKSSLAKALQDKLQEPYVHLLIEEFLQRLPERYLTGDHPNGVSQVTTADGGRYVTSGDVGERVVAGFYAAVAAFARQGNNVIVDTLMGDPFDASQCALQLEGLDALMVGLHCPLPTLEERERSRGDRMHGLARGELTRVHAYAQYDVELDTSLQTPEECADAVIAASNALAMSRRALSRMRQATPRS